MSEFKIRAYYRVTTDETEEFTMEADSEDDLGLAEVEDELRRMHPFEQIELDDFDADEVTSNA